MDKTYTGNEIRQMYIDFFEEHGHTFVPSSSLVPGGDSTLLFTNAGMVQFKDVFLSTDDRPYTRAVNSQKCMRVAGKHNDLEDVGRDDTHHTFFEMLGNWSFGDYYKKEAIAWGWQLLTEVWGLPKERLYASVFKDEKGEIPTDEEAAQYWLEQPGFDPTHLVYLGRKDNFWEMADTGPCGPNSEIHYDLGPEYGEFEYMDDGQIDLDASRFVEVWNLVFIQFNRIDENTLEPLPKTHVDTGMGFDRIVSILQGKSSNYRTDLFWPVIQTIQSLAGQSDEEREANFTPYRVIADHARAAAFLIADGVVPGNLGRNYITRMIIRRAARFGTKLGLNEPFLAKVAATVIEIYGDAYPELAQHRATILDNLTREEERFQRTVESGIGHLEDLLKEMAAQGEKVLDGAAAFDLYQTYGLPLEITRDILQERDLGVDDAGFREAMEEHRIASGAGHAMGEMGVNVEFYRQVSQSLQADEKLPASGVAYDPYHNLEVEGDVLALMSNGKSVSSIQAGDLVEVILPETCFYVASGGQVADHGTIVSEAEPRWEIRVDDTFQPAAGLIVHVGEVVKGEPKVGDTALAAVDRQRRQDIMRNHTATHLLHSALHRILGEHARQAGSLVAPDRLRFDFTHPEALTAEELAAIEEEVNHHILDNYMLNIEYKSLDEAKKEGAMALFGEKYGETVRTIQIGDGDPFSYELCGGTHVDRTGDIGLFLIVSEGSAAAGIRRIEAVTGREAYTLTQRRFKIMQRISDVFKVSPGKLMEKAQSMVADLNEAHKTIAQLRMEIAVEAFNHQIESVPTVTDVPVLTAVIPGADTDTLRQMSDRFRQKYPSGVAVLAGINDGKPMLVATVTDDLVARGLHAGKLVKLVAEPLGGGGGGRPNMAQAGGKDAAKLDEALALVPDWVQGNLKD